MNGSVPFYKVIRFGPRILSKFTFTVHKTEIMKYTFALLFSFIFFQVSAQEVFDKLLGGWETEAFGGRLHNYWQKDIQGGYSGIGIFMEGADTTYREHLRILKIDKEWVLVASPEGADPFVFKVTSLSDSEIKFENERFRNPQKVFYQFKSNGTFYRRTQGRETDGSPSQNEYAFWKIGWATSAPLFNIPGKKSVPQKAEILAPEVLSSDLPEFATAVSPNGKLLLFNRTTEDRKKMYMMYSIWENGTWGEPQNVHFSDGTHRDVDPSFTPDGGYLFFSSNRPLKNRKGDDFNVWVCKIEGTEIGKPQALTKNVNTENTEIFTSLTKEGHLYFSRRGENMRDIIRCELKDKKYQPGEIINLNTGEARIGNPMVAPDESYIIFNGTGMDGFGQADLYLCWKNPDGSWSTPLNMGEEINSEYVEFAPSISSDGQILYFTSERPGMVEDFEEGARRPGDLYSVYLPPILNKLKN